MYRHVSPCTMYHVCRGRRHPISIATTLASFGRGGAHARLKRYAGLCLCVHVTTCVLARPHKSILKHSISATRGTIDRVGVNLKGRVRGCAGFFDKHFKLGLPADALVRRFETCAMTPLCQQHASHTLASRVELMWQHRGCHSTLPRSAQRALSPPNTSRRTPPIPPRTCTHIHTHTHTRRVPSAPPRSAREHSLCRSSGTTNR